MNLFLHRVYLSLMTLGLVVVSAFPASAVTRPFHLVEHGTLTRGDDGRLVTDGTGQATQLGRFTLHRVATLRPSAEGSGVEINGHATLTAANGDRLETSIQGVLDPLTGHAVLTYEWEGGTGRFENATGATVWQVQVNLDDTYDAVADGVIDF